MKDIQNKNKKLIMICLVFMLVILVTNTVYALYVIYIPDQTNIDISVSDLGIVYNKGVDITGDIPVALDKSGAASFDIELWKTSNVDVYGNIYVNLSSLSSELTKNNVIKWEIWSNGEKLASSSFKCASLNTDLSLYQNFLLQNTKQIFTIYIWADFNLVDTSTMSDASLTGSIKAEASQLTFNVTTLSCSPLDTSGANPPQLIDGMIPVMYDQDRDIWVKADEDNFDTTYQWYDYDNKMWANAVMVNDDAEKYYLKDSSSNGYDAELMGGASVVTIDGEKAIELDGIDDYISVPTLPASLDFVSGYTVEVTMRWKSIDASARIMDFGVGTTDNLIIAEWGTYNTPFIAFYNDSTRTHYQYTSLTFSLDTKETYKFEFSPNGDYYRYRFYLNGTLGGDNGGSLPSGLFRNVTRTNNYIGKSNWSSDKYLNAYIYDFKILDSSGNTIISYDANNTYKSKLESRSKYVRASVGTEVKEEDILAYYVWIPRYKYVLFNSTSESISPQEIEIEFESTAATKSTGSKNGEWLTHPAFTFGTKELSGIWIGKFETTGDSNNPTIKPNLQSLRSQNVSTQFETAQKINTNVYVNSAGVSQMDAHMMKNTEWGAVAYLSYSKYGNVNELCMNNSSSHFTGRSGGAVGGSIESVATHYPNSGNTSTNEYYTYGYYTYNDFSVAYDGTISIIKDGTVGKGTCASTTGNVYGIYDMSGGAYEYVMGVLADPDGNPRSGYTARSYTAEEASSILGRTDGKAIGIWNSGYNGLVYGKDSDGSTMYVTSGKEWPNEKYYNLYTGTSSVSNKILGDATGEVRSWYSDYNLFVSSSSPWFLRDGDYDDGAASGLFSFGNTYGPASSSISFRVAVAPIS